VTPDPRPSARRRRAAVARELAGGIGALAGALVVVAVAATTNSALLFTDGDSVLLPLIVRSLALGQPQDWAMSPVLFLPETGVYGMLSLLGLGMRPTLTLNAVVNLLALYGALRVVSGRRRAGRSPVAGALLAFLVFCALALLESAPGYAGFRLALLQTTTTYYAATVVAAVAAVGLVRRAVERGGHLALATGVLAVVSAASVLTNPLFALWAALPLAAVLVVAAAARRVAWRVAVLLAGSLVVGGVAGWAARGLFAETIVAQSANYFRGGQWEGALAHFAGVLARTVANPAGIVWLLVVVGLMVLAGVTAARAWRSGAPAPALVAAVAVLTPLVVTIGVIAVGSDADRYLQVGVFLPVAALAARPVRVRTRTGARARTRRRMLSAAGVGVALVVSAVAAPIAAAASSRAEPDLDCVVDWVQDSGRTGAGQFWTVRAPKARLDDPARLVQVDHTLRPYTWLTNRADAVGAEVTFLVTSADTGAFALPAGVSEAEATRVACGRYTILDFGDRVLPLGTPRD
jgi:hypothetical protein